MAKDITKLLHTFIKDVYSYRDDLTIEITKTKSKKYQPFYTVHILVHIKLTDGIYFYRLTYSDKTKSGFMHLLR